MISREDQYRRWLESQGRWSQKALGDLVSRLRRVDKIMPLDPSLPLTEFERKLTQCPSWELIPRSSKTGMLAAVRLYMGWLRSS